MSETSQEGRVAVVTGGATGIGAAIARRLSAQGWLCVLVGRREERLKQAAEEIGGEYEVCDVADRESVERVAAEVSKRHPRLGLLVNNAGISGRFSFLDAPPERIEEIMRTNYLGSVWCTRAFLPALEAAAPSWIVNVVSVAGHVATGFGPYSASKHAQLAFSRSLAVDARRRGIRVLTVSPGFADTEGFPQERLLQSRLRRRMVVTPDHIADRVVRGIERGRTEIFVPRRYRLAAWAQAGAPGGLARLGGRKASREGSKSEGA